MDMNGRANGFSDHGLSDENFGESKALKAVKAFDAFPKTKASYTQQTSSGGVWTVVLVLASLWLAGTEVGRWWKGNTSHTFDVETGIGHDLQLNFDMLVKMKCEDLHINVQDASGDLIKASMALKKDPTTWMQWQKWHKGHALGVTKEERLDGSDPRVAEYLEQDVHNYIHAARGRKNFRKTPRIPRGMQEDCCRIAGSMHTNKVQGDFHITARGHGYMENAPHLNHDTFNFTHHIMELSFGPFYPSLINPLDDTTASTENHFHKFQYYLSIVPTVYTTDSKSLRKQLDLHDESPTSGEDGLRIHPKRYAKDTVFTNQFAVTEQSHAVSEHSVPGIFIKYDIEPIVLTIAEDWASLPALFIRLVNVVSGVLVTGGWLYTMSGWAREIRARGKRQGAGYDSILTPSNSFDKKVDY